MDLESIRQNVLDGDSQKVKDLVQTALSQGVAANTILKEGLIAAMEEVGRRYENGDFYVPEMLIAARAMQAGLNLLKPHLIDSGVKSAGKIAIGTVKGDLHDIGKNLVAMMLEGAGFEVQDLGTDVSAQTFLKAAQDGADIIGMSALLTTTMGGMQTTIQVLREAGLREKVKVVVGGAPVTDEYSRRVGADAYAPDASSAVRVIRQLIT